jgi:hypothetical protein
MRPLLPFTVLVFSIVPPPSIAAELSDGIGAPGQMPVAAIHAVGAQVYECRVDTGGKLVWLFREPIATLLADGKTVGRHYAGPSWEMSDGSVVTGKVTGRAPGASPYDIPLLKLDVTARHGAGMLASITTIQRVNTRGGVADGACNQAGEFLSAPYAADYVLYRGADDVRDRSTLSQR